MTEGTVKIVRNSRGAKVNGEKIRFFNNYHVAIKKTVQLSM